MVGCWAPVLARGWIWGGAAPWQHMAAAVRGGVLPKITPRRNRGWQLWGVEAVEGLLSLWQGCGRPFGKWACAAWLQTQLLGCVHTRLRGRCLFAGAMFHPPALELGIKSAGVEHRTVAALDECGCGPSGGWFVGQAGWTVRSNG